MSGPETDAEIKRLTASVAPPNNGGTSTDTGDSNDPEDRSLFQRVHEKLQQKKLFRDVR